RLDCNVGSLNAGTVSFLSMDLSKDSSKGSLSRQDLGGSSISSLSKGKQIFQGHREVFTHFISLPLAIHSKLQDEVKGFQASVVNMGFHESLLVSPSKLHLTVVMLNLKDVKDLDKAKRVLKDISKNVNDALDNRPVAIRLRGLECMEESLDKTRVLYAPVEEVGNVGRLLRACHVMIDAFVPDKLAAEKAKSRLRLHLTMMSKGETFDAREIQRMFREKDCGSLSNLNHVYNKEHSRGEKQLCMNNLSKAYLTVITVNFKTMGIDRVVGFTSRCLKSKQERFRIMSFKGNAAMDGGSKKEKMVNLVWRPISTRSSSVVYSEAAEGQCSKPSGVSERAPVVSAGKHSVPLEVGASLMKFIKGKEGTTQMKIEEEMGVKIIFPSSRNEDHIIIEGGSVDCVTKASERIATIVDEVVKSPSLDYSHFVSLPLAIHPELVAKLVNFQNSILGNQSIAGDKQDVQSSTLFACSSDMFGTFYKMADLGIEKSIFIKPSTFHLTVLMLKLWNKDRFNTARDVLKSISPSVMDALDNQPIFIRLKGLDCMRGSLAKARVLYIPVEEIGDEGRLLRACKVITDAFVKAGLVLEKDANQSLKLHATVMNARHRKRTLCGLRKKMDSFDAREIHKQFGNEDWGEYLIQEAHLSQRFVFDQSGYYHCCASIPFENTETEKKH
ncbi:unnamed protein product, partial [Brassica oleracea var. botrytis]